MGGWFVGRRRDWLVLCFTAGMPPASDILSGLSGMATGAIDVSIAWHIALLVSAAAFFVGLRPSNRVAAVALSAPLGSVAVVSTVFGNPFNAAVFAVLAALFAVLARRAPEGLVALRSDWSASLGFGLLLFGAVYPHFLEGLPWLTYFYAAPLGVIPCPTLSAVIGAALLAGGFGLGAWRLVLAAAGVFYGLFGMLRLGVLMDAVLFSGAVGLLVQLAQDRGPRRTTPAAAA